MKPWQSSAIQYLVILLAALAVGGVSSAPGWSANRKLDELIAARREEKPKGCDHETVIICHGVPSTICTNCEQNENPRVCRLRHLQAVQAALEECDLEVEMFAAYSYDPKTGCGAKDPEKAEAVRKKIAARIEELKAAAKK